MKKFVLLIFLIFTTSSYATTATSSTLRNFSKIIKIAKTTPHPVMIIGGFALTMMIDALADIIDEANATPNENSDQAPTFIPQQIHSNYLRKSFETENSLTRPEVTVDEAQEESQKELPTVVIVHGFVSSDKFHSPVISPLTKQLIQRGFPVYIAKISKIKFAAQQAELLHQEIRHFIPHDKEIILIGHSLGGIISRQYAFNHWRERVIRNVISIGTPHWGVDHNSRKAFVLFNKTLNTYKNLGSHVAAKVLETTQYLSEEYMSAIFNYDITDVPGIDYLSTMTIDNTFSKRSEPIPETTYRKVIDPFDEKVSDALVTVRTSMWTKMLYADKCVYPVSFSREIRGPLYEANHITQVSTLSEALSLKSNAYKLGRDIINYILESLNGGYVNPSHCDPF